MNLPNSYKQHSSVRFVKPFDMWEIQPAYDYTGKKGKIVGSSVVFDLGQKRLDMYLVRLDGSSLTVYCTAEHIEPAENAPKLPLKASMKEYILLLSAHYINPAHASSIPPVRQVRDLAVHMFQTGMPDGPMTACVREALNRLDRGKSLDDVFELCPEETLDVG